VKRLTLLAFTFVLSAFIPVVSRGQSTLQGLIDDDDSPSASDSTPPQRIGVPSSEFHLSSNQSGSVSGFCFDEYLIAPRRVTRYSNVLAGKNDAVVHLADGSTIPLTEAIDRGTIAVRAVQLNVVFTNRSDAPVSVELRHPAVFWDRPGGDVNPMALNVLDSPNDDYDSRQERIWRYTTSERELGIAGYYNGSVWNIDRGRFDEGVKRFQKDNGLEVSGQLDNATMTRLAGITGDLSRRLERAGFFDTERHSLRSDVASEIRAYQNYLNRPRSGQWSSDLDNSLKSNEEIIKQIAALRNDPRPVDEALKDRTYPNVITYLSGPKGMMALVDAPGGIELWSQHGNYYTFAGRNEQGAARLDDAAAQLASRASRGNNVVIYPRALADNNVRVAIGDHDADVDASGMAGYLRGSAIPDALSKNVAMYAGGGSEMTGDRTQANVVVYRGPLSQGRFADPQSAPALRRRLGLNQVDGAKLADALDRTYGSSMALYVSDNLRNGATRLHAAAGQRKL
jgi:hypothetical protein